MYFKRCLLSGSIQFSRGLAKLQEMYIQDVRKLEVQRKKRREKDQLVAGKRIKRSQDKLIHSMYRHQWYKPRAHIKGNLFQMYHILKKLNLPTAKMRFIFAHIEMWPDGLDGKVDDLFVYHLVPPTWVEKNQVPLQPLEEIHDSGGINGYLNQTTEISSIATTGSKYGYSHVRGTGHGR